MEGNRHVEMQPRELSAEMQAELCEALTRLLNLVSSDGATQVQFKADCARGPGVERWLVQLDQIDAWSKN